MSGRLLGEETEYILDEGRVYGYEYKLRCYEPKEFVRHGVAFVPLLQPHVVCDKFRPW